MDLALLERAYLALQQAVHPDRFASGSDVQKRLAIQMAAQANMAHKTLLAPASRAVYLCELGGADVGLENNTAMPTEFLVLQMQWRETFDEVRDDPAGLDTLRSEAVARASQAQAELTTLIDEQHDYRAAAAVTRQLVFIEKFLEDIRH